MTIEDYLEEIESDLNSININTSTLSYVYSDVETIKDDIANIKENQETEIQMATGILVAIILYIIYQFITRCFKC